MQKYERKDYSKEKLKYRDLSKEEIKKEIFEKVSQQYKNPTLSYKRKLNKFEQVFEIADNLAYERRERPVAIAELRNELIFEYYKYQNSFIQKYMTKDFEKWKNHSIKRQFAEARKLVILDRFKNFRKKYGSEKIHVITEYINQDLSFRTIFTLYKQGKISKEYLFSLVELFKDKSLVHFNSVEYRQRDGNAEFSRYASK